MELASRGIELHGILSLKESFWNIRLAVTALIFFQPLLYILNWIATSFLHHYSTIVLCNILFCFIFQYSISIINQTIITIVLLTYIKNLFSLSNTRVAVSKTSFYVWRVWGTYWLISIVCTSSCCCGATSSIFYFVVTASSEWTLFVLIPV